MSDAGLALQFEENRDRLRGLARRMLGSAAEAFKGRARGASRVLIDGLPGAVWAPGGTVRSAFLFTVEGDRVTGIEMVMDPARLQTLRIEALP